MDRTGVCFMAGLVRQSVQLLDAIHLVIGCGRVLLVQLDYQRVAFPP